MLAAPHARSIAIRLALAAALGLFGATACQDSSQAGAAQRIPDAAAGAAGEIVIPTPTQPYTVTTVTAPATISGTVTLARPIAPRPALSTGRDSAVCGATIPDESIAVRASGVAGAVVWLAGIRRGKAPPVERRIELESLRCRLTPRVQAAVVNSAVNVLGHDDFRQHLRFEAGGEREPRATVLLGNYEQVIPTEWPLRAPGLVRVRDADHAWPAAFIAIFDHPYFAVSDSTGAFTLDGVPPGRYVLTAWHERTKKAERPIEVVAGGAARASITLEPQ